METLKNNLETLDNKECTMYDYSRLGTEVLVFFKNVIIFTILTCIVYIIVNMYSIILKFK